VDNKIGKSYLARKALFAKGIKDGRLTVQEIEDALPPGTLTAAERWLLYYSLRAAQVEILDEVTGQVDHGFVPDAEPEDEEARRRRSDQAVSDSH
jgi:hypothetical protein